MEMKCEAGKGKEPTVKAEEGKVSDERFSVGKGKQVESSPQLPPLPIRRYRAVAKDERVSVGKGKEPVYQLPQLPQLPNKGVIRKSKAVAAAELSGLLYEAKSSKDLAWYDVKKFLNYRHTASGELETLVRFANFGVDHGEWLNAKRCIRQRSVPLEDSECHKVQIGDLVMCFKESEDRDVYLDAHVLGIERNKHEGDCTCTFSVRYDDDLSEDRVRLSKLCVRPPS